MAQSEWHKPRHVRLNKDFMLYTRVQYKPEIVSGFLSTRSIVSSKLWEKEVTVSDSSNIQI